MAVDLIICLHGSYLLKHFPLSTFATLWDGGYWREGLAPTFTAELGDGWLGTAKAA
jgi:hypothetical protein